MPGNNISSIMAALRNRCGHSILTMWFLLRTIAQFCRAVSSQVRHVSTIGKKLLNSNISSTCSHNMVNFGPLEAEIGLPL